MRPHARDTRGCNAARDPSGVQHPQDLRATSASHYCAAPQEPSRPPRSLFTTKVASAPSQRREKSSWNCNSASPSWGWWGADRAATRYACLGWERAAHEISSRHHSKSVCHTLTVYVKSSITETSTWKQACQQQYMHTHVYVHTDTHRVCCFIPYRFFPLELSPVDRKDRTECHLLFTAFFIQYYTSYQQKKS